MIKQWQPVLEDINREIVRLRVSIEDVQFNNDFSHQLQLAKLRSADLHQRLSSLRHQMKGEAEAERAQINLAMAEFASEIKKTASELVSLHMLRAERARANYLHIQALKAAPEKGGEA